MSGEGFIDGVVNDLVNEMVEATAAAVADVHVRAFSDGLDTAEDFDVTCVVTVFFNCFHIVFLPCSVCSVQTLSADSEFYSFYSGLWAQPLEFLQ